MQHDPNERSNPMGEPPESTRGSERGGAGAAGNQQNADLSDTTGNRSASAFSDTSGTMGRESLGGGSSRVERRAEDAKEMAKEKMNATRERAYHLKATLADKLEQGADKLRHRVSATPMTEMGTEAETRARRTSEKVADRMQNTAGWLRNADVDTVKSGLESQVRSNPGRTLLVALGVGYVFGRLFRGNRGG